MLTHAKLLYLLLIGLFLCRFCFSTVTNQTVVANSTEVDEENVDDYINEEGKLVFEDAYFGNLVPSTQNVTFLTVDDPEYADVVLVYPSDKQKRLMKVWRDRGVSVRRQFFRFKREQRCELNLQGFVRNEFGEIRYAERPSNDVENLAFDNIQENSYFRAFLVEKKRLENYVDTRFGNLMNRVKNDGKPWLPADALKEELKDCHYLVKTFTSNQDFKFNKETGGNINYYKFSCEQVLQYILFAFATYDCRFELTPKIVTEEEVEGDDAIGTGLRLAEAAKNRQRIEKRHLTWKEKEDLIEYIGKRVRRQILIEYKDYFKNRMSSCSDYKK